jgi:hypothetical protein
VLGRWINDNTAGLLFESDPRLLVVRLEDLTQQPRAHLPAILAHVGAPSTWDAVAAVFEAAAERELKLMGGASLVLDESSSSSVDSSSSSSSVSRGGGRNGLLGFGDWGGGLADSETRRRRFEKMAAAARSDHDQDLLGALITPAAHAAATPANASISSALSLGGFPKESARRHSSRSRSGGSTNQSGSATATDDGGVARRSLVAIEFLSRYGNSSDRGNDRFLSNFTMRNGPTFLTKRRTRDDAVLDSADDGDATAPSTATTTAETTAMLANPSESMLTKKKKKKKKSGLAAHDELRKFQVSQPLRPVQPKWPIKMTAEDKALFKAHAQAMRLLIHLGYANGTDW